MPQTIGFQSIFISLTLCVSFVQDYPKLSQNYYGLLECLAQDHMTFVSSLEPQVFLYLLSTISEGLVALGVFQPHPHPIPQPPTKSYQEKCSSESGVKCAGN